MKVSIVIPTSNGSRFLGPCLESLRKTRLPPGAVLEPIVVDNGSSDRTPQILAQHPEVKSLVFERAMGFAQANNAARKVATGDLICFLNNDTQVDPGWLDRPLQILARDARVAGIGSKLLYMHRYVPVRFSLPRGGRLRATASMFGSPLNDKVRFSPDVRDGWVHDGSVLYVPLPVPGIDPPFSADPVVRLAAPAGTVEGATVTVCASAPRSVRACPRCCTSIPEQKRCVSCKTRGTFSMIGSKVAISGPARKKLQGGLRRRKSSRPSVELR